VVVSGERVLSVDALRLGALRAASALDAAGVGLGDKVGLVLRNDFPYLQTTIATGLLGAAAVPVNWHGSHGDVDFVLSHAEAKVVVVHEDLADRATSAARRGTRLVVVPTPPELAQAYPRSSGDEAALPEHDLWDDWLDAHEPWGEAPRSTPSSVIYTSGTTGRPKGVERAQSTPEQMQATAQLAATLLGVAPGGRVLVPLPLYHAAPNAAALFAVHAGASLVLQPRFDAEELLALIERHRITSLVAVPTMFVRLLKLADSVRQRYDLTSLQHVSHTAAPCPPDVKRRMIQWWGPIICEYYGATETGAVTFCDSAEWLAHPGTVGRAVPGAIVKVLDEAGSEVPTCETGEIYARLTTFSDFTYAKQDDRRREIDRAGLVTIGDVGYLDEDDFLFLCDRKSDMVIFGGTNVYPAEIEAVLFDMPDVEDCAVFGIPDENYGEVIAAAVQPVDGATLSEAAVIAYLIPRLASYKVPRVVEIRGDLPREASGKIFKRRLRDQYKTPTDQVGR
jgi:long-chain acyl-CoA synthetase